MEKEVGEMTRIGFIKGGGVGGADEGVQI